MANIRKLYEADQTTQLMPQTHERAVVDDNGTTAETKFGLLQGLINQKQLEVGAVPIDLTPTKDNTDHIVSSDGMYESLQFDRTTISPDIWITSSKKAYINGSSYVVSTNWDYVRFIPVTGGKMVRITAGALKTQFAFIKDDTTITNGRAVPYATGETGRYEVVANASADYYLPNDTYYIVCQVSSSVALPDSVVEMLDLKSATAVVRKEFSAVDAVLEEKKQDKYYYTDLTNANIIASRDDINNTTNNQRVTLRMQPCHRGDIIICKNVTMLVRTFDKRGSRIVNNTGWISTYTIADEGYYTAVVNSGVASGGTVEFLLSTLTQKTGIETLVKQYVDERWDREYYDESMKRNLLNDSKNYYQFTGVSPLANQIRITKLCTLAQNQGMSIVNDYLILWQDGGLAIIYDFKTFKELGRCAAVGGSEIHPNAAWASGEYYDPSDILPIIYMQTIRSTPAVIGVRVYLDNDVWKSEIVHRISREGETGGAIVIYDQQKDRLIYNGTRSVFTIYNRPTYASSTEGVSILTESDIVSSIEMTSPVYDYGQGNTVVGNVAIGCTYSTAPGNMIFGANLDTGVNVFTLQMPSSFDEGEGMAWYNGKLYVADVQGDIFEVIFP